jgi:hypothetical protein
MLVGGFCASYLVIKKINIFKEWFKRLNIEEVCKREELREEYRRLFIF